MSQGSSVEGFLVARLQLQSSVTVLFSLIKSAQFQQADGSKREEIQSKVRISLGGKSDFTMRRFTYSVPVCVESTFIRFHGETVSVLLQSLLVESFLDKFVAFLFQ